MVSRLSAATAAEPPPILNLPPGQPKRPLLPAPRSGDRLPLVRVLTARTLLANRPGLLPALHGTTCAVRLVDDWSDLLEQAERQQADVVIVDLDAAQYSPQSPSAYSAMSGYRLAALLARHATRLGFAVILQTALDFSEVEDLLRQGVHLLIHPDVPDEQVARHIRASACRSNTSSARDGTTNLRIEHGGYVADWMARPAPADTTPTTSQPGALGTEWKAPR